MRIAVDAMGGDRAPASAVAGAVMAAREGVAEIALVGRGDRIAPELRRLGAAGLPLEVIEAAEVIAADDQPAQAVKRKKDSSIVVGARLVKDGAAGAFVSAGNTGALMAAGLFVCGRIPGVRRPAISGVFPTVDGVGCLVLDLGAHMDATPLNLLQYAVMGSIYAEKVRGIPSPRVGLLNVGSEENKGNELTKEAYPLLKQSSLNFVGNVEGRDIFSRHVDVVVCDGFVGNVLLKTLEGLGQGLVALLKKELASGWRQKAGALLARPGLRRFGRAVDYREYGGAPILGVDGILIKCHGSSDERAILNGVRQAVRVAGERVNEVIRAELAGQDGEADAAANAAPAGEAGRA